MDNKTNVMRILDQKKIDYTPHYYSLPSTAAGEEIAKSLNEPPERVFKTLVTVGKSGDNFVYMIPVCKELNLKKAAAAVGEKKIDMLPLKELLPKTGYVHGGCSPIGMKKPFPVTIDISCKNFDSIMFSGGKIGCQVEMTVEDFFKSVNAAIFDLSD